VASVVRPVAASAGATLGWTRLGLGRLAALLAVPGLVERAQVAAGALALEALCARVVHRLEADGALGRFAVIADRPGLPRALARSLHELRMAAVEPAQLGDADLARAYVAYVAELEAAGLADRAGVLRLARERARSGDDELLGRPLLLLDVPLGSALERDLVAAVTSHSDDVLATCPAGDQRTRQLLEGALGVTAASVELDSVTGTASPAPAGALGRLQSSLFGDAPPGPGQLDGEVSLLSAPGESRECVEIARQVVKEAARGIPFDQMAVLLRTTHQYRPHLEEAFRRASVPVHFAQGTVQPDPSGRAFLALLACAAEGLSARRFAEYVSLGEVPDAAAGGGPPAAPPPGERCVAPDEESLPGPLARGRDEQAFADPLDPFAAGGAHLDDEAPVSGGTLRAPRRWERLLVEAAVIGGLPRWVRRLDGLAHRLQKDLAAQDDPDAPARSRLARDLGDLESLRGYALPLLELLAGLPRQAAWRQWLDALSQLAARALRRPERVLAVLAELEPMASVGPVGLREVRLALGRRLTELVVPPAVRRYGRLYVGTAEGARGLSFEVVFVPGLAEKLFPQKVSEDPILRDEERARLSASRAAAGEGGAAGGLRVNADRVEHERLALRLAVGAARSRVCFSYPRLDTDQSRPRTPSFYALEVLRAAEGRLPGFDELARRAEKQSSTRLGWPAPASPHDAIDDAEHDLSLLSEVFQRPVAETAGTARYLLGANLHLARALRARFARWDRKAWMNADGLVLPVPLGSAALARHQLAARSYSPTALQSFAACPYKFVLYALHKLSPREEPAPLEELDPLQKGSLVHDMLYVLHVRLRDLGMLPVRAENHARARAVLDQVVAEVAAEHHEQLCPAIPRVWDDGVAQIKADLTEWLRRALDESWTPTSFELSFGLVDRQAQDPRSTPNDVALDQGLRLRGSIDLVETDAEGALRVTDYKTGKARAAADCVIGGGETLQPVLYALVLEKLFPGVRIEGGRLYYCTSAGDFRTVSIPLDDEAREGAGLLARTLGESLSAGFLPAAPVEGACRFCDFQPVCGPHEEQRTRKKDKTRLKNLQSLRDRR
jgi:RecB family exonuclease